ncbi:MAG: glycosyltransferase family 4 protein, partial [Methanothrix sp.]
MRIGMFSWESLYSIKVGGVAPHVSELSEALAKRGNEVHIFTRRGDFDSYDRINGVHYQRVEEDSSGDLLMQMAKMSDAMYDRFARIQKIYGKFDLVHGHDWHPVSALKRIKTKCGIPYVLTMHSTEWGRCGNNFGDERISHQEWLAGYESAEIIVTTQKMKKELMQIYSIPETKISIVPNGMIPGKIMKVIDSGSARKVYGLKFGVHVVLFCGRMSYQKGPDLLVEAIPHILKNRKDVAFIFAGEGDMMHSCEEKAKKLKIRNACRFLDYIPAMEKEKLINACDIVCVPSRNEPFGVIVLEAWDAAKPLVATEAVSIIRNFEDGLLAYIQP